MQYKGSYFNLDDFDEGSRKIKVYLSAFGNVDAHNDIIVQGAFSKTLKERFNRIKYLWQHSIHDPIGKWLEMGEDSTGLWGVGVLSNATKGQDAFEYYKEGIINEHSIGFDTIQRKEEGELTYLQEIRLWEGSAVTFGANEKTPVIAMAKSLNQEPLIYLKERESKLFKFLRNSTASDEAHDLVEMELRQITETYRTLLTEKAAQDVAPLKVDEPFSLDLDLVSIFKNN